MNADVLPKELNANANGSTANLEPRASSMIPKAAVAHLYINNEYVLSKSKSWANVVDPVIIIVPTTASLDTSAG